MKMEGMKSRRYVVYEPEYRIRRKPRMRKRDWDDEIVLPFRVGEYRESTVKVKETS